MKRSLAVSHRLLSQTAVRTRPVACRISGARWSSTESGHQWSTPLAKQLAEAITVRSLSENPDQSLIHSTDYRPNPRGVVYAAMPHFRFRWLLHIQDAF